MKIAFVGKGGSGKSTISSLFINYISQSTDHILAIDADVNAHLAELLGIEIKKPDISEPKTINTIKEYLIGDNKRIKNPTHMQNTTPPAKGSNLIHINAHDEFINTFADTFGNISLLQVGAPMREDIGTKCYHNNLKIAEIILNHIIETKQSLVIADMVAGVDAFSTSLHLHFDYLFLVVEPTRQSVTVAEDYHALAKEAGIADRIKVVANKIESLADEEYLEKQSFPIFGKVPYSATIKNALRDNLSVNFSDLPEYVSVFNKIKELLYKTPINQHKKLKDIIAMHRSVVAKRPQNIAAFGDLTEQIDETFQFNL